MAKAQRANQQSGTILSQIAEHRDSAELPWLSATAVDNAIVSRLNSDRSYARLPLGHAVAIAGGPAATCAVAPASRA